MKLLFLSLLTCTSAVFAMGEGGGTGLLGSDGTSLDPVMVKCFYHNESENCPNQLYETKVIYYAELAECSKDPHLIAQICNSENDDSTVTPISLGRNVVVDPECFTHETHSY